MNYFINQRNVISLFNSYVANDFEVEKMYKNLILIANKIYIKPQLNEIVKFDSSDWDDYNEFGHQDCDPRTHDVVQKINQINNEIYKNYSSALKQEILNSDDNEKLYEYFKEIKKIDSNEDFIKLFEFYFNNLLNNFDKLTYRKILNLINWTISDIPSIHIKEKMSDSNDSSIKIKCKKLLEEIKNIDYYKYMEEQYE